jgi:hypothetical protein
MDLRKYFKTLNTIKVSFHSQKTPAQIINEVSLASNLEDIQQERRSSKGAI